MKKKFQGNARVKRSHLQALRREFEALEMLSGEKVIEYFSRVMTVANKVRNYGEDMPDVKVVESGYSQDDYCSSCTKELDNFSAGCQVSFPPWKAE